MRMFSLFGMSAPFCGAQTGSSIFGGTSTGTFGVQGFAAYSSRSAFGVSSSPAFGVSSSPAFGNSSFASNTQQSQPGFGVSSTPAFGGNNGWGAPSTPASSTPGFGGGGWGVSNKPASSTPGFGGSGWDESSKPSGGGGSWGDSGKSWSESNKPWGETGKPWGESNKPWGETGKLWGESSKSASSTPGFGGSGWGESSKPSDGGGSWGESCKLWSKPWDESDKPWGESSKPWGETGKPWGESNKPWGETGKLWGESGKSWCESSKPASSTPGFGGGGFDSTPSGFGAQGAHASTPPPWGNSSFHQLHYGGQQQQEGSRAVPYSLTVDAGTTIDAPVEKVVSISAMHAYKEKSHEELMWEDYQRGDKGGPLPAGQFAENTGFSVSTAQPNTFSSWGAGTANSSSLWSTSSTTPSAFGSSSGFGTTTSSPLFSSSGTPGFGNTQPSNLFNSNPSIGQTGSAFAQNGFAFGHTGSTFGQTSFAFAQTGSTFGQTGSSFGNTQPSNLFSANPSFGQTDSAFGQTGSTFGQTGPAFAQTGPTFGQTGSAFGQSGSAFGNTQPSNLFNSNPSIGQTGSAFGNTQPSNLFSSNPSIGQTGSAFAQNGSTFGQTGSAFGQSGSSFGNTQPSNLFSSNPSIGQTGSAFAQNGSAFGQTSAPTFSQTNIFSNPSTGFGNMFSTSSTLTTPSTAPYGQTMDAGMSTFQSSQPAQVSNGFGFNNFGCQTQPANATGNVGGLGFYGQGNFVQTPAPPSSFVLQPVPVTNPFGTLPPIPQMNQSGTSHLIQYGISSMPVVDKPVVVKPLPVRISSLLTSRHLLKRRAMPTIRKYRPGDSGLKIDDLENYSSTPKADAFFIRRENPRALFILPIKKWPSRIKSTTPKNRHTTPLHENVKNPEIATDADHIEGLLPKLHGSGDFTEPSIRELEAKERADPGYCSRVRDFVVGRHGYGSIKFPGETDVRGLDLESLVRFENRQVDVYLDETMKPAVGEELNKPAEITLLNVKCMDKKGKQFTEGEKVEKYKMFLKKKCEAQGAEFVSYDPVKCVWKFRVDHF